MNCVLTVPEPPLFCLRSAKHSFQHLQLPATARCQPQFASRVLNLRLLAILESLVLRLDLRSVTSEFSGFFRSTMAASKATVSKDERVEGLPSLQSDLILRVARGEATERLPVWVMRQAGR